MGVEDKKISPCGRVFWLHGPKGGLCVGFSHKSLPGTPEYDTIRLCVQSKEQIQKTKEEKKCFFAEVHVMTAEEAMRLGAALIQAAGFYKATMNLQLESGFYAEKWETPKKEALE